MSNIEETKMTDEAFVELINNFEVVGHLTEYGRKAIKQKVKEMQSRIKELESKLEEANKQLDLDYVDENYIPKQKAKEMQAKIKELEEENKQKDLEKIGIEENIKADMKEIIERYYTANEECIPKQKVKDILNEIQEEYDKVQEQFDCIWNKKSKDNYDRYKLQELSAMQQELGFILGKFEKLLEEGE